MYLTTILWKIRLYERKLTWQCVDLYEQHLRNSRVALKEPMVLGHESAGVIIETGKLVKNLVVGDRVALEPGIPCYRCSFCKQGSNNLCREVKFFGSPPVHGSLAQQVS